MAPPSTPIPWPRHASRLLHVPTPMPDAPPPLRRLLQLRWRLLLGLRRMGRNRRRARGVRRPLPTGCLMRACLGRVPLPSALLVLLRRLLLHAHRLLPMAAPPPWRRTAWGAERSPATCGSQPVRVAANDGSDGPRCKRGWPARLPTTGRRALRRWPGLTEPVDWSGWRTSAGGREVSRRCVPIARREIGDHRGRRRHPSGHRRAATSLRRPRRGWPRSRWHGLLRRRGLHQCAFHRLTGGSSRRRRRRRRRPLRGFSARSELLIRARRSAGAALGSASAVFFAVTLPTDASLDCRQTFL
mmetsp:Transcript_62568/g.179974  ORF Transcript_62568/g.179974 Transcript_62568/m.179974 type:complete len:300 (-) Transcript_62568:302-1201(-)